MQKPIQFETVIENGVIQVPAEFLGKIPSVVKVILSPVAYEKIKFAPNGGPGEFSPDSFSALKIDTRDWKFDREEANERR